MLKVILVPVTTVHVLPAVKVTMADASVIVTGGSMTINGVSYKQVQNSFGTDAYSPFDIYMQSENLPQLTTPMQFFIFDSDGNKLLSPLTPTVDPYQANSSIYFQPKKNQVVFNGNSGLHFSVLPLTQIIFQFICLRTSNQSLGHAANFRQLEKVQNVPSFFLEYDEDLTKKAPLVLSTKVINNTTATQTIDLFSSPYDLMQNVNNHTEYKWDITGILFPPTVEVTLQYMTVSAITFSVYDTFTSGNLLAILDTLNALGVSYFYTYSELGIDYIATYSDTYVFGDLTLDTSGSGTTTTTTTSTTTAVVPPTTTTTTSTTTATPPPTTTTTTTSTTTGAFLNINYIATSAGIGLACSTATVVGAIPNTGNFCTATQLTGASLIALPPNTYYFSYGGNYLVGTTNGTSVATITGGGCLACPIISTTTTTTSTTTAAPTTTTTTTTTSTTTSTVFNLQVGATATAACYSPIMSANATSDTGVYCTANTLTSSSFVTLANGNYYVSYLGQVLNINIAGFPTTVATVYSGGCTACVPPTSTTTTTSTTTAAAPTTTTTTTTSTTTAVAPTTTTTTTTSTTTSGFINVTFYAELNAASANAHTLWYSTDAWATSAIVSATNITTVGGLIGTIVIPRGATLYAAVGNSIDITASTAVSGKVSVTPNDYAALPLACGGSVSVTEFVDFTWNILANSLSFNLACTP